MLDENRAYVTCLHQTLPTSEDLMADFTADLLEKAASSDQLSDIRALYLAPQIVPETMHVVEGRNTKIKSKRWSRVPRHRPNLRRNAKPDHLRRTLTFRLQPKGANNGTGCPGRKACLLSSVDSPITVDIPTEMKRLHSQGDIQHFEYIPGQLEFSPSAVEAKLKEFSPGSSAGPSGWRCSHPKELLKAKRKL